MANKFDMHERPLIKFLCDSDNFKSIAYEIPLDAERVPQYRFDAVITRGKDKSKLVVSVCRKDDLERVLMRQLVADHATADTAEINYVVIVTDWYGAIREEADKELLLTASKLYVSTLYALAYEGEGKLKSIT